MEGSWLAGQDMTYHQTLVRRSDDVGQSPPHERRAGVGAVVRDADDVAAPPPRVVVSELAQVNQVK